MPPLREQAETLRLGLWMGLVSPLQVIGWADRVIAEMPDPPIEVIDVAVGTRLPLDELARLLRQIPGPADLEAGAHRALGLLRERMKDGLELEHAARIFWVYSTQAVITETERRKAIRIEYALDDLIEYGTPEALKEEIDAFLEPHATDPGRLLPEDRDNSRVPRSEQPAP